MLEPVTMDDWDVDEPRREPPRAFWPVWSWPLLVWLPLDAWHARLARDLPPVEPAALARMHLSPEAVVVLATVAVAVLALAEAGCYGMLWAARGRRLPVLATAVAVLQCGITELLALDLLERWREPGGVWLAVLVGPRGVADATQVAGAFAVAFGGTGLLALARLALFAGFQSRFVACRWREAFALTCGVWLASHLAQAWVLDLVQGRSLRP